MAFPFLSTPALGKGETLQGLLNEKERLVDIARQSSADRTNARSKSVTKKSSEYGSLSSLDAVAIPNSPDHESSKSSRHRPFGHRLLPFGRHNTASGNVDDRSVGTVRRNTRGSQEVSMCAACRDVNVLQQLCPDRANEVSGRCNNEHYVLGNDEMPSLAIDAHETQAGFMDPCPTLKGQRECTIDGSNHANTTMSPHEGATPGPATPSQPFFSSSDANAANGSPPSIPKSTYPATELFRTCASLLTTPLGYEFALDPTKLNAPRLLFSPFTRMRCEDFIETAIIVDIGGEKQDSYTASLAKEPGIRVQKMILQDRGRTNSRPDDVTDTKRKTGSTAGSSVECPYPLLGTDDYSRLPYSDASVNIISARMLHKGIRIKPGASIRDLHSCLSEFHRVLVPGGCLEYIFFENELSNPGPLTAELEYYLLEGWLSGALPNTTDVDVSTNAWQTFRPPVSLEDFLLALSQAGFNGGRHTTTKFSLFTLSQLFDHKGTRRPPLGNTFATSDDPFDEYWGARLGWSKGTFHRIRTLKLLSRVLHECESRRTGWRCAIGWATKRG